jgi:2-methylcitrate dehydratase PrpD
MRSSALGAAFANAAAANALDVDDSARYAYGHAGVQVFAAALAVAEARGLSGAQMLTGMVVGYETAHRVGGAWHASRSVYQACGSWGSVACAAVAAHLMGLPPEQAGHALGIAEYYSPNLPMMRDIDHPAMVKHGVEWAALTGIVAAELASRGFTGIPGILSNIDPARNDMRTVPDLHGDAPPWARTIGREYLMVDGVAGKPARYACCGWAHAGVEGARRLVLDHTLDLDEIERIQVEGSHGTYRLGARLPGTTEEAQFNQAWPLAAMLVDGEIGPDQMLAPRLSDERIRSLAQKVEVVESVEMEQLCRLFEQGDPRGRFASRVVIEMKDGRRFETGLVDGGLRFPQAGWDAERMAEKFRWLAGFILPATAVEETLDMLRRFDRLPSVTALTDRLAPLQEAR